MTRRLLIATVVLASVGLATPGIQRVLELLNLGAAYKAKLLCSSVFVAGRDEGAVLDEDLAVEDLWPLRWLPVRLSREQGRVIAGVPLIARQTAVFRPGLGCVLTHGGSFPVTGAGPVSPSRTSPVVDQSNLDNVLDWAFAEPDAEHRRRTRAVVVMQDGRVVGERYAAGFGSETPLAGWSLAKLVVNAMAGIAVGQGRVRIDAPLDLPEWRGDERAGITLGQLLQMSSGLAFTEEYGDPLQDVTRMLMLEPDAGAFAAGKPLVARPGSRWYYASGTSNIISRYLRSVLGSAEYDEFPRRALFGPLGMDSAVLEQDAAGHFVSSSFMYATARDWARLGQLYLQGGEWEGRRLLPKGWVEASVLPAPAAPDQEYGSHIWLKVPDSYRRKPPLAVPADAFHAIGFEGQFITVIPSRRAVLVRLGLTRAVGAWPQDEFIGRVLAALAP